MNLKTIFLSLMISVGYAGWGVIAQYSKANAGWVGFVVMAVAAVVVGYLARAELISDPPSLRGLLILAVAAILNGIAVYLYSKKVTDPRVPTAAFIVTVFVFSVMMTPLLNWVINDAVPNKNHLIGFVLTVGAIYFLGK